MRKHIWFLLAFVALALGAAQPAPVLATIQRQVPTLYLHGHRSGPRAMAAFIKTAQAEDHATSVLTATVNNDGAVKLHGRWPVASHRPLIKVVFKNNRTLRYGKISDWLAAVITTLQHRYHIRRFNIVAHSLGNAAVLFYELRYGQYTQLPQLQKYVAIAGNFDGVPGVHRPRAAHRMGPGGKPPWMAPAYLQAMHMRSHFPKYQVSVLNIYGDLGDGRHWDGKVNNVSSRSLRYLLGSRLRSYEALEFTGPLAQHRLLRTNPAVIQATDHFLWP
ncbi:alpha/beta hydrolase [Lacticaseibacillus jixianensis]|uniref:Alpha/beta hydrolase n=1 Tax=Lacticaseibacillus jixianensis TaxID=2486012 RepID=A0ABW4B9F0_9LACO|nr:alpha/beta hydrolase [Lacticaseibacillus jixianensis]